MELKNKKIGLIGDYTVLDQFVLNYYNSSRTPCGVCITVGDWSDWLSWYHLAEERGVPFQSIRLSNRYYLELPSKQIHLLKYMKREDWLKIMKTKDLEWIVELMDRIQSVFLIEWIEDWFNPYFWKFKKIKSHDSFEYISKDWSDIERYCDQINENCEDWGSLQDWGRSILSCRDAFGNETTLNWNQAIDGITVILLDVFSFHLRERQIILHSIWNVFLKVLEKKTIEHYHFIQPVSNLKEGLALPQVRSKYHVSTLFWQINHDRGNLCFDEYRIWLGDENVMQIGTQFKRDAYFGSWIQIEQKENQLLVNPIQIKKYEKKRARLIRDEDLKFL